MHLLCIIGPPAAGKMTVGRVVCELTGFRLFHNHMSIEPLLGVFDFGSPSFQRINTMIRRDVVELYAPQAVRLAREGGEDRMDLKRSKRDVAWARAHVVELEERARFTSDPARDGDLLAGHRHLRLDNGHEDVRLTAERIVAELDLPRP